MKMKHWFASIMIFTASTINAQNVPYSFNYQGILRDGEGHQLSPGNQPTAFKLYTQANGGAAIWGRTYQMNLDTNGLFNVELSDAEGSEIVANSSLAGSVASNATLFIGLTVEGSDEIAPRQQLLSVPYAMMAGDVKEASGNLTVGGTLQVDDGAEITGTLQATTSVEIGTAGGGLATLTSTSTGALQVPALDVAGNATIQNDLTVNENLTVTENMTIDGTTTLNGTVNIISHQITNDGSWHDWSGSDVTMLSSASSDGFLMVNINYEFDVSNESEKNYLEMTFYFSGVSSATRDLVYGRSFHNIDGTSASGQAILTLPVLKGEEVVMKQDNFTFSNTATIQYRKIFIPFGVNQ